MLPLPDASPAAMPLASSSFQWAAIGAVDEGCSGILAAATNELGMVVLEYPVEAIVEPGIAGRYWLSSNDLAVAGALNLIKTTDKISRQQINNEMMRIRLVEAEIVIRVRHDMKVVLR